MNIQLYFSKNNFEVQKARRFFKERRVPFQEIDLKKHAPGRWELQLFAAKAGGLKLLIDPEAKGERAVYARQLFTESILEDLLLSSPELLRGPIIRDGGKVCIGFDQAALEGWIKSV